MLEQMKKSNVRKIAVVLAALVVLIFSMTVVTKAATDPANHTKTLEALDEKKADVLKLTASSAAASTAIAAIPGDATTPVANKLADLTSYFLIILMVVFLEKYLVTLTGYAAFFILIPAACVLIAAGVCLGRRGLKILAAKIAVFGLVIFLIIPMSMQVSSIIEDTYESTLETTVQEAEDITDEINENTDSEGNILEQALSKIKNGVSGLLEKALVCQDAVRNTGKSAGGSAEADLSESSRGKETWGEGEREGERRIIKRKIKRARACEKRHACAFCMRGSLTKKWHRGEKFRGIRCYMSGMRIVIVCIVNPGN